MQRYVFTVYDSMREFNNTQHEISDGYTIKDFRLIPGQGHTVWAVAVLWERRHS